MNLEAPLFTVCGLAIIVQLLAKIEPETWQVIAEYAPLAGVLGVAAILVAYVVHQIAGPVRPMSDRDYAERAERRRVGR